jgi:hypothetical protein
VNRLLPRVVLTLVVGGLAGVVGDAGQPPAPDRVQGDEVAAPPHVPERSGSAPSEAPAGLAQATRSLPPAEALPPPPPEVAEPVSLHIDGLGIEGAPIVPVGVEATGEMEVPEADEVGWYRHGPAPGEPGSGVLAAHIAYNGVDGVFRHLSDLDGGAEVVVAFDDGTSMRFVVSEIARYAKTDLPDDVFAREGDPRLALITCGGDFDHKNRSYEDNVVAYARPVPEA